MFNFNHVISNVNVSLERVEENGQRFYKTPDGVFPSVTTVTGWEKKNFFSKWRKNNPEEAIRVCSRGNKLHSIIENYLNNNEDLKEKIFELNDIVLVQKLIDAQANCVDGLSFKRLLNIFQNLAA